MTADTVQLADAAAVLAGQARTLVNMAGRYSDRNQIMAVHLLRGVLLEATDNDRAALATSTALLAVLAEAGEVGAPYVKCLVAGESGAAARVARAAGGGQDPDQGPGPGADLARTCSRCVALAGMESETGLTGAMVTEGN